MPPTTDAFLRSWPFDPWLLSLLGFSSFLYLRGWLILRSRDPGRWTTGKLLAFLGSEAALLFALASPIETFASLLLQVHMVQHLLLMMVAPLLVWLGAPLFPLLRGLPAPIRSVWIGPLYRWRPLRRLLAFLTHPVPAGLLFVAASWLWHVPALYELALRSAGWHYVQHFCFLITGLLFWYPVVRPYPAHPRWSRWLLVPYLLLADVSNTVLSALLTFSSQVLYPHYSELPSVAGTPLEDQVAAGVIMWVPGSVVFLVPLLLIGVRLLFGQEDKETRGPGDKGTRTALPMVGATKSRAVLDVLRIPLLGNLLRWRHARWVLQLPLLLLAGVVIWDGLYGPQVGPMNLAGVLPWIHWRGILILGLLILGNVFCMACPFLVPRTIARWVWNPTWPWPHWLRSKWLAVALLALFLWAYEAFALWDSPWLTAWIALAYFAGALVVDACFRGASFCKYVCPIGQFNFVQSLISPFEVKVADHAVCTSCRTKDCIRGRDGIPGCELHLYQPRKAGNLDCTYCLDCIHACPHDNVGILAVTPAAELWHDPLRSGIGRFSRRSDLAALVVLLVFGAFANAAGMVEPVVAALDTLTPWLGASWFYLVALVLLPAALMTLCAVLSRTLGGLEVSVLQVATRFAFALVPLGFAMWLTHYSFHFLASYEAVVPVGQRFLGQLGLAGFGAPDWVCACCKPVSAGLLHLEFLFLECGLLLSWYASYRISRSLTRAVGRALAVLAPWFLLQLELFALGIWIVLQPMQMRGTM